MQLRLAVVGDDKDKEEGQKEEEANGMTLLPSSFFYTMTVWRRDGGGPNKNKQG